MRATSLPPDSRANNFDLIRLFAAAQVAVVHICEHLQAPQSAAVQLLGFLPGVPIFFFVSGFLVSQSFERAPRLTSFYRNRVLRVYPALLACLVFSIALAASFKPLPWTSVELAAWLVAQTTIGQFFNPTFLRDFGVGVLNGSLWTIPVELQFYLALPIVYALGRALGAWVLWASAVTALAAHTVFLAAIYGTGTLAGKLVQVTLLPWFGFFLIGVLAQRYWPTISHAFRGKVVWWSMCYAAVAALLYFLAPLYATGNRIQGVSALALFGVVLSAAYTAPNLSDRILRGNDISYGLYLYHAPLINVFLELSDSGRASIGTFAGVFAVLAASVAMAIVSWTVVERPALGLKGGVRAQIGRAHAIRERF